VAVIAKSGRSRREYLLMATAALVVSSPARAQSEPAWDALRAGAIALFRHAIAPGVGDPPGMRLDDCATQRNLDEAGRAQARRIGEAFRLNRIAVDRVSTSRWCRAVDTAELAFPGMPRREEAFDSFFDAREERERRTALARAALTRWRGPGAWVVVTHQVNIQALTGISPASGEGVVVRGGALAVVGRIAPG
jgi:phosphohistidine phosphatase SixA